MMQLLHGNNKGFITHAISKVKWYSAMYVALKTNDHTARNIL